MMAVFGALCIVTLLLVAWPVAMGLWPMLVVAMIHLAAVGWCFRRAWRNNWAREIFRVKGEVLTVERLTAGQPEKTEWPVAWARIEKHAGRFGETRLMLASQGRCQEIGAFLPAAERERLGAMLEQVLRHRSAWSGGQLIQVS